MRILLMTVILVFGHAGLFSLQVAQKYVSFTDWKGKSGTGDTVISGRINIVVTITRISSETIRIHIFKEMTPFGQILDFDATAFHRAGKYEFNAKDNWDDSAFGYLVDNGETLTFFLDCTAFSDDGKNLARLYGGQYTLTKQ